MSHQMALMCRLQPDTQYRVKGLIVFRSSTKAQETLKSAHKFIISDPGSEASVHCQRFRKRPSCTPCSGSHILRSVSTSANCESVYESMYNLHLCFCSPVSRISCVLIHLQFAAQDFRENFVPLSIYHKDKFCSSRFSRIVFPNALPESCKKIINDTLPFIDI